MNKIAVILCTIALISGCGDDHRKSVELPLRWNDVDSRMIATEMYSRFTSMTNFAKDVKSIDCNLQVNEGFSEGELVSFRISLDSLKGQYFPGSDSKTRFDTKLYVSVQGTVDEKSQRKYFAINANWIDTRNGELLQNYNTIVRKEKFVERGIGLTNR